jgi:hypothetical protein
VGCAPPWIRLPSSLRAAQYFFIRSPMAFFSAAVSLRLLRRLRLTGSSSVVAGVALAGEPFVLRSAALRF